MSLPRAQTGHAPPLASIGLPVFNGEKLLPRTLDSLLGQTFTELEVIISDNASTDGTEAICRDYARRDARIRYVRNEKNIGARPNFNQLVGMARGRYFKWAAHDDLLAPQYMEKCVAVLEQDRSVALCHSLARLIDDDGDELPLPPPGRNYITDKRGEVVYVGFDAAEESLASRQPARRFRASMMETGWVFEIFGVIRTDVLRRTPLLDAFYGADKVLLAQIALQGRVVNVQERLFLNRRHAEQSRSIPTLKGRDTWMDPGVLHSLFLHNWRKFKGLARCVGMPGLSLGVRLGVAVGVVRYYVRPGRIYTNLKHYRRPEQAPLPEHAQASLVMTSSNRNEGA
ncbi:MAG: glycosyltransferase [Anaerolineae bacterium]|nr:glycosyltransferase [Anaerolineae bacterium]